jgi:FlaA1/EpsC-like NDP-sugar epimerase
MTVADAVRLVMESVFLSRGGEVFVTKMPVARIVDLAEVMVAELAHRSGYRPADIEIRNIGTKAGEKLYEELMSDEEARRTIELQRYFAVVPAFKTVYKAIEYDYAETVSHRVERAYNSSLVAPLSRAELTEYLRSGSLLQ